MKLPICCIVGLIFASSCNIPSKNEASFTLLPQPKHFIISGASSLTPGNIVHYFAPGNDELPPAGELLAGLQKSDNRETASLIFSVDSALDLANEGYSLVITDEQISIHAKDRAGLFYAFTSLHQLMEDATDQHTVLPLCEIEDYPSLAYRAVHLDLKHHLEKEEYYYEFIRRLAQYKVNGIIVEFEDKLGYQRQPSIASPDAMHIESWVKLSKYARERNIEISPLVQGLGHASFILKHEAYKDIRDDEDSDWAFNPLDPGTYDVQFDLYLDAMEATPFGRYLHVGGDEVQTSGRNSGKSQLELQLIWLNKVCRFAEAHGRIPIFWDDMPLKHAGVFRSTRDVNMSVEELDRVWEEGESRLSAFLDQFPKNCIYMRWNYSIPQAQGNLRAMQWFTDHGLSVMGATAGQTRWHLMPQNQGNMENIKAFALSSIHANLNGLLLTLWDDSSPLFELYWRGIIFFSEFTWAGEARSDDALKSAYRQREFGPGTAGDEFAFIDRLELPVGFWASAFMLEGNRDRLKKMGNHTDGYLLNLPDPEHKGAWNNQHNDRLEIAERMLRECDTIRRIIEDTRAANVRHDYTLEVYEQVNNMVEFSSRLLLELRDYDSAENEEEIKVAQEQLKKRIAEFPALRKELERVYGEIRILHKPANYLLDQDHHNHAANQSLNFDWQFYAEILYLEKLNTLLN